MESSKNSEGRIVYLRYLGYGSVREDKPEESHVLGWREPLQKNIPLKILEDIAWM